MTSIEFKNGGASAEAIDLLENFWPRVTKEIQGLTSVSETSFIVIILK
jgi:hypothetical protein